jgi:ABC-2 type transport system ATP-binding protein
MDNDVAIRVNHVSKTFRLPHEKNSSVKSAVINFYRHNRTYEKQQALKDVSFEVKKGEFFGIVGRNGGGKSTLLKLLAGIYTPSQGSVDVNGKLTPFIELGVGFNPELTGRENVFLNGALLGFNRKEMQRMYKNIVEFAELERFMDQKLKNYSSGMQVRLAFSIAIRAKSDILILDEVLAVGDEEFQNKCLSVFEDLKAKKQTIILVTHDMASVKRFCDRAIVIKEGSLVFEGSAYEAATEYTKLNFPEAAIDNNTDSHKLSGRIVKVNGESVKAAGILKYGDTITLRVEWEKNPKIKNVGIALFTRAGEYVFGTNTDIEKQQIHGTSLEYDLKLDVGNGDYNVQIGAFGKNDTEKIYYQEKAASFKVSSNVEWQGVTHLKHEWRV